MKVETITFSFGQVFLCVHACKRERGGGHAMCRVNDTGRLNSINQIS